MAVAPRETPGPQVAATPWARARSRRLPAARDALVVLALLIGCCGLAAALGGARAVPELSWLVAAVAAVGLVTLAAWAADRRPAAERTLARVPRDDDPPPTVTFAVRATPLLWVGLALLGALAAWTLASLTWSARPDLSWDAFNREAAYLIVLICAVAAGTSAARAPARAAAGVTLVTALVALRALGGVIAPSLFDHAAAGGRPHEPLETFLDLGILCGLVAPVAVRLAASGTRSVPGRLLALAAALVMVVALGLTASRAGTLVLVAGLAASLIAGGARLRTLAVALLVAVAAAVPLALAWSRDALGTSADDGRTVGVALLAATIVVVAAGWFSLRSEERALQSFTPGRAATGGMVLAGLALVALLAAVVALAASERGLSGSVSHAVDTATASRPAPATGGGERLTATDNGGRRQPWSEALGAASGKPLAGWGAGAWPVVHALYRSSALPARDARSSVLQTLAERGAVGLTLLALAVVALLAAVAVRLRGLPSGRTRDMTAAALGAGVGLAVALVVASSWEVPALVLPVLVLAGVAAARPEPPVYDDELLIADPDPGEDGWRWGVLAVGTVVLALLATSALLPAWSHNRSTAAERTAQDPRGQDDDLRAAASDARLAAKLDPPAVEPEFAAADVAQRRGRLVEARDHLVKAVDEQPDRAEAWARLAQVALALADRSGALTAARKAVALDPHDPHILAVARQVEAAQAPPSASPTATGTPLPSFVVR